MKLDEKIELIKRKISPEVAEKLKDKTFSEEQRKWLANKLIRDIKRSDRIIDEWLDYWGAEIRERGNEAWQDWLYEHKRRQ